MSLQLAVLQHEPETGLGRFENLLDAAGVVYDVVSSTREPLPEAAALDGVIVLGGSLEPHDATLLPVKQWIARTVAADLPYLGVCLGGELLADACGAPVRRTREVGVHDVFLTDAARFDPLFCDLPGRFQVFGWHAYGFGLPRGAIPLAGSLACTYQAFRFRSAYGLQFHPEVRVDDLERWRQLPANRRLLAASGREWSDVVEELRRAELGLEQLAAKLLERWLALVAADALAA
jgi:GMP synthase (glutamine-hydrolysing)